MLKLSRLFMLTIILFINACQTNKTPLEPVIENDFALYLLADTTLTGVDARKIQLDSLQLAAVPLFTLNDIKTFNWREQSFTLESNALNRIRTIAVNRSSVFGIPFVMVAQNSRRYMGAFWYAYSSYGPDFPTIEVIEFLLKNSKPETLNIGPGMFAKVDKRYDQVIHNVLLQAGKLRD